jgi:putative FmdB family regulatory protein
MPTYEYQCPQGHVFEKFQKMSDKPRASCPTCGKPATRKISGGAGLVFKGSGFYITDYGKDGKGPRKPEGEAAPPTESKPAGEAKGEGTKSDAKPPGKAESAPAKPNPRPGKGKASSE